MLASVMLQSYEGLQQSTVLVGKLLAIGVLLNLPLTRQSFSTGALEWKHLVSKE